MRKQRRYKFYEAGDKMRIRYKSPGQKKSERLTVTIIASTRGRGLVAVDKKGRVYTTFWDQNASKPGRKRSPYMRHWRCFRHGLAYLHRGLIYALINAEEVRTPTIEELKAFCAKKRDVTLSIINGGEKLQMEQLSREFDVLQRFLEKKERWPLVEARTQLSFFLLLRDSLGRLNIGVLKARLTTINARFATELKHLAGWTPQYAARFTAVHNLQRQIQEDVLSVQKTLTAMTFHGAFKKNQTTSKQVTGIQSCLRIQIALLQSIRVIEPFVCWGQLCLDDLIKTHTLVGKNDFIRAKIKINRLVESIKLRIIGFALEDLIGQLGLDMIRKSVDPIKYLSVITDQAIKLGAINESGFKQPVCGQILSFIESAAEAANTKKYADAKEALKQAVALI